MSLRAEAFETIARGFAMLAAAERDDASAVSSEALYDAQNLPPGAVSWRAVLDAGRRGHLEVTRIGRRAVVTAGAWRAFVASKGARACRTELASAPIPRATISLERVRDRARREPSPQASDVEALAALGLAVPPLRAVGGARG